jgi:hypothetical protein
MATDTEWLELRRVFPNLVLCGFTCQQAHLPASYRSLYRRGMHANFCVYIVQTGCREGKQNVCVVKFFTSSICFRIAAVVSGEI